MSKMKPILTDEQLGRLPIEKQLAILKVERNTLLKLINLQGASQHGAISASAVSIATFTIQAIIRG